MQYGPQGRSSGNNVTGPSPSGLAGNLPSAVSPAVTNRLAQIMSDLTITPRLAAAATTPTGPVVTPTVNFTFSQIFSGGTFSFTVVTSTTGTLSGNFSSISRSVAYPGVFTSNLLTGTITATSGFFLSGGSGSLIVGPTNNSFSVSGPQGGTLTGTGSLQASAVSGAQTTAINLSGPVSIAPTGAMTFTPTGTFTVSGGSPTASGTVTNVTATSH